MNKAFFGIGKKAPFLLFLMAILCSFHQPAFAQPSGFSDELVIDGWSQAVGVTFDKNGRMYVWEKGGKVWSVENGVKSAEPLVDISEEVGNWRDFGLVGFALDPNFLNNGHIYLWYVVDRYHLLNFGTVNYNSNASNEKEATIARLTRYTADASNNFSKVNYQSRKVLVGETKSTGPPILHESHGAGQIIFGTDGTLMVTVGDGASYANPVDEGSHPATYYQQALDDGIITPEQNIGAYRCQSLNNLSGKILRIDPATGNGVPSNPYYQANNPRSPQSRTWSIGARNPYRIALRPETGSHNAMDGDPGTFFFGDVGWSTWEDLNVIDAPGQNFGWPIYEGITHKPGYNNPDYAVSPAQHERPKVDWRHGADQARAVVSNTMTSIGNSQIQGSQFRGNSSTGGIWYTGEDFPEEYQNTYFHADYSTGWIRNFGFNENNDPTFIKDFKLNAGAVVFLNTSPTDDGLFYVRYPNQIRRIVFTGNANKKPIAVLMADKTYGASPLTVQFDASQSFDPEYSPLTYEWDLADGATSTVVNPKASFSAISNVPTTFMVKLKVTDQQGASSTQEIPISLNNTPPIIVSTSLDNQNTFSASNGVNLNLSATVIDTEHNGQLKHEWQTALFHNGHSHAEPIDNNPSTTTSLSPIECDGSTYWFRITLKVTDPEGLFTTYQKDIFPDCGGSSQSISMTPISDQPITAGSIVLDAVASSGLPVSAYLLEGPAVIFGNKIVLTGFPGKVGIRVTQGGNSVYKPAMPIEQTFNVIIPSNANCSAEGLITRDIWSNGGRNAISDIPTSSPPDQVSMLNRFEVSPYTLAENAQRIRGFICPPQTGLYTFWISSEEESQLWLSTNGDPKNRRLVANIKGATRANQWNKFASQQSEPILLVTGNKYYIETLMNGGGHLSAGWKMPDNSLDRPISGKYLSPWQGKEEQIITFFGIPDKIATDAAFSVGASVNSGLPVDFKVLSGPATVSGTTVTLTGEEGTVIIEASQKGNNQYVAARSVERRFEVVAAPTVPSINIDSPTNGSIIAERTVTVRYTLGGDLTFHKADHLLMILDNQSAIDIHNLNGQYTLENLSTGLHTLKIHVADHNHKPFANPTATAVVSFTVKENLKAQTINFSAVSDKKTTDVPFIIGASASSGLPVQLSIQSGPASINNNIVTLNGQAGTVVVRATQTGNSEYSAAAAVTRSFKVNEIAPTKLNQTISFGTLSNKLTTDGAFVITATTSSGLPVSFTIHSGPASINGQVITLQGIAGTVVVSASQSGNTQYNAANTVNRSFTVTAPSIEKLNQSINFPTITNKYANDDPFVVEATASSGLPVSFKIESGPARVNGNIITLTGGIGTVVIRASQNGNEQYNRAISFGRSFVVNETITPIEKSEQTINFSSISNKLTTDRPFPISANATSDLPVTLSIQSGPAVISSNIITLTGGVGTVVVQASQNGNSEYKKAENINRSFTIYEPEKSNQLISFPVITNKKTTDNDFSIIANSSSGLPIIFSVVSGPASVNGNTIRLTGVTGRVVIRASQNGNKQFHPAPNVERPFEVTEATVEKLTQSINFPAIPNKLTNDRPFIINASASSGLPLIFKVQSGPASISGNTITLNGTIGTVVVQVSQAGNNQYHAATSIGRSFLINQAETEIEPTPENPQDYCTMTSLFPWQEWIGQVTFGDIDNTTSKKIYTHFSDQTTTVKKGGNYPITIVPVYSWTQWDEYIKVWIDFNGDGDFEDSEENIVSAISTGGNPRDPVVGVSATITIPSTATEGTTRMRISMQRENYTDACGSLAQGEIEDYTITINGESTNNNNGGNENNGEPQDQVINFPPISDQLSTTNSLALNVSSSSNLPVTLSILSGPASIDGNVVTLIGTPGTIVINASQSGNTQFKAAQSTNRAFKVIESEPEDNTGNTDNQEYCTSEGTSPWQEWIANVSFGNINNNSFKEGYKDFSNQSTSVDKGASYTISVLPDYSWTQWNEHIAVWIDFNGNGSFTDVGEQVLSGINLGGAPQSIPQGVSGTVTIPSNAREGTTRMRVSMQRENDATDCDNFNYGEVEDYRINITTSASNRKASILTFAAYANTNQTVELEWISNGDWQAKTYQIERSTDNLKFYPIQELLSEDDSTLPTHYYAEDMEPIKGMAYYRIKQINVDGSFKYSNGNQIDRAFGLEKFYLYPNPVRDRIHINLQPFLGKATHIKIYNPYGQLVKERKLERAENSLINFSLDDQQNGVYYLSIQVEGLRVKGKKFILNSNY